MWILAIMQSHLFKVKGIEIQSVYFYKQNIITSEYVNCFLDNKKNVGNKCRRYIAYNKREEI